MSILSNAISKFTDAVGLTGNCDALCQFNKLGDVVKTLPGIAERLFTIFLSLDDYVGPNATKTIQSPQLKHVLQAVYSITHQAQTDINRMYTLVFDTITVTLPELAKNITSQANLIMDAIEALPDCPVAATFALMTAKDRIEADIATVLYLKVQFEDAFYITSGELPAWLQPTKDYLTILEELVFYLGFHSGVMKWNCDAPAPANPPACQLNRSVYDEEVSVDPLIGQLSIIGDIVNTIQTTIMPPIDTVTQLYYDITSAWDFMKNMFVTLTFISNACNVCSS